MHALRYRPVRGLVSPAFAAPQGDNPHAMLGEIATAFADFRDRNDNWRAQVERQLDDLARRGAAGAIGGTGGPSARELTAAQASMVQFMRSGMVVSPQGAMTTQSKPDGGYTVPREVDGVIDNLLLPVSPMRRLATVVQVTTGEYHKLINRRGASSGWVGEEESRPETNSPILADIEPPIGEVYAMPSMTQVLIDDSSFNLEAWLDENVTDEFSVQENAAFVTGNGFKKPKGFLDVPTSSAGDSSRAFGTLQYVPTGHASSFPSSNPGDAFIELLTALKPQYRAGPGVAWQMNSTTLGTARKFKDGQGNYIWSQGLTPGMPETILGYPVEVNDDMQDLGANAFPVAFGNWKRGYVIVDRIGTTMLRDPYTKKGWVNFYFTKRVGGAPTNTNAIKLMKCAVS